MDPSPPFDAWAPPGLPWTPWAKPVLFGRPGKPGPPSVPAATIPTTREFPPELGLAKADGSLAVVVDLMGPEAIGVGLRLARSGFRPVPLFNGCPAPPFFHAPPAPEVVPVSPLIPLLFDGAEELAALDLPDEAPPAFLLDADRFGVARAIHPGWFDNRWAVFATDFPSARALLERRVTAARLVHRGPIRRDLIATLRAWARGGVEVTHVDLGRMTVPAPPDLPGPARSALLALGRALAWPGLALRRKPGGGYGRFIPEGSSGG